MLRCKKKQFDGWRNAYSRDDAFSNIRFLAMQLCRMLSLFSSSPSGAKRSLTISGSLQVSVDRIFPVFSGFIYHGVHVVDVNISMD